MTWWEWARPEAVACQLFFHPFEVVFLALHTEWALKAREEVKDGLIDPFVECVTHSTSTKCRGDNLDEYRVYTIELAVAEPTTSIRNAFDCQRFLRLRYHAIKDFKDWRIAECPSLHMCFWIFWSCLRKAEPADGLGRGMKAWRRLRG